MVGKYYWALVTFPDAKWTPRFDWSPLYAFVAYRLNVKKVPPKEVHLQFDANHAAQIMLGPFLNKTPAEFVKRKVDNCPYGESASAVAKVQINVYKEIDTHRSVLVAQS